jgi:hypothetical protein
MQGIRRAFVLAVGLLVVPIGHATQIFRVGSDAACTQTTIQDAIDAAAASPGEDYVWIAANQDYSGQHVTIQDQTVDVVGGFADCSASDAGSALTTVSGAGNGGNAVFKVRGTSHVYMSNLWIRDADRSGDGGGIDFSGAGDLHIAMTTVSLNTAAHGGGINFHGSDGAELRIGHDTLILRNTATGSGGGIRIDGSARFFVLEPQTLIAFNSGAEKGGGIEMLAPAHGDIASPGYNGGAVLQFNDADYGGGVVVNTNTDSEAILRLFSIDPHNPVQISDNIARRTGGGVWLSPYGSFTGGFGNAWLCAQDFRINNNIAQEGAAIYGDVDTDFSGLSSPSHIYLNTAGQDEHFCEAPETMEDLGAVPCAADVPCNELAYNVTENSDNEPTDGAVILVQTLGNLVATRFRMHHNVAAHLIRSVDDDAGADTDLSRCLMTDNQLSASAIQQTPGSGGWLRIDECTFSRNSIAGDAVVDVDDTHASLTQSIFDQPGVPTLSLSGFDDTVASEVMSNDLTTVPPSADNIQATPLFVDPDNGDYHLRRDSPGIDYASDGGHFVDLDGKTREVDLPNPNVFGMQDLGALETQLGCSVSDSIFCNGFDSE